MPLTDLMEYESTSHVVMQVRSIDSDRRHRHTRNANTRSIHALNIRHPPSTPSLFVCIHGARVGQSKSLIQVAIDKTGNQKRNRINMKKLRLGTYSALELFS